MSLLKSNLGKPLLLPKKNTNCGSAYENNNREWAYESNSIISAYVKNNKASDFDNRPGVAGAVLQTLIKWLTQSSFVKIFNRPGVAGAVL